MTRWKVTESERQWDLELGDLMGWKRRWGGSWEEASGQGARQWLDTGRLEPEILETLVIDGDTHKEMMMII